MRLINPSKPEIGRIAKKLLEKINTTIRRISGLQQWKNTADVVTWYKKIQRKQTQKFIQFDVVNFYPSITKKLLSDALKWARQFVVISIEEQNIILEAKNSLLFKDGTPWAKKGDSFFDIGQGSYDGAETCELVGLFILAELATIDDRLNIGIYRDDGLASCPASPRQVEIFKQQIEAIFTRHGLGTVAKANDKKVNFLDVTFDLEDETFCPYIKENNKPLYVHKLSNHPPAVTKNIPAGVSKRLSSISSDERMFEKQAQIYRDALADSGYDLELKFDPHASEQNRKKRKRSRVKLYFNPPWNSSLKSNIGRDFLSLMDRCFPPGNPLQKLLNRNTIKVSYSCTPNMEKIISGRNKKLLATPLAEERLCSCTRNTPCPLDGKCLSKNVIYEATVTQENQTKNTYTGLCSTDFKARLGIHKHSFKNENDNQTSLSKFIWTLKRKNIKYDVTWKILDRGEPFSPISGKCTLCIKEKFHIIFNPTSAELNSRDEIFSNCRHKIAKLLIKRNKSYKRKRPGG